MSYTELANSTFLDAFGAGLYTNEQYQIVADQAPGARDTLADLFDYGAQQATVGSPSGTDFFTVGLILDRLNPAEGLLQKPWAERQDAVSDQAAIWARYGADTNTYNDTVAAITNLLGSGVLDAATNAGYVSSVENRTIWITIDKFGFEALFGTPLFKIEAPQSGGGSDRVLAWTGNLAIEDSLPSGAVRGVWVDRDVTISNPLVTDSTLFPLQPGPLGIGNSSATKVAATPAAVAANYNFPLPADVPTAPIALVESNVAMQAKLFDDYNAYRVAVGLRAVTHAEFQVLSGTDDPSGTVSSELTLDISVVAGAAPNSTQLLYSHLTGTSYNAYQQAFFDTVHDPEVLTSSYSIDNQPTKDSPFHWAWHQLFVDGVLSGVSTHIAGGDEGSSATIPNGSVNVSNNHTSPYALIVGGTSIAGLSSALTDRTLADLRALALRDDPAVVFALVAAGLKTLPSHLSAAAPTPDGAASTLTKMFEAAWQNLDVTSVSGTLEADLGGHETASGGIAPLVPTPSYQSAFGLDFMLRNGRGVPDVAALSSGDSWYAALNADHVSDARQDLIVGNGGTSAATPLWASLTTQFNVIFADQNLHNLGYYNDLLYIAAVIAPGSFNDVQLGDNNNSFYTTAYPTGYYDTYLDLDMVPTNQGYSAGVGYDLVSGLGTPNGLLLARALTVIAHQQVSYSTSPAMLEQDGAHWTSGTDQNLLFQMTTPGDSDVAAFLIGGEALGFESGATASLAWTTRLAQQSLQVDFDPGLAILFDKQAQGAVMQTGVAADEEISVWVDGANARALQASLSSPFGFADFFSGSDPFAASDAVRVARPIAVAQTVDGLDDQTAVVRIRQVGENSLSLQLYQVDDLSGTVDGILPGQAGYAQAAATNAYLTTDGASTIAGPGYGGFTQVTIADVDSGDLIAMKLTNVTTGAVFWAFAALNETVNNASVSHLWNYGANTWGWEDQLGGGDHDYNDMVVQLDFTSTYGSHWLL